ncbi:unnamed protein product [Echinostoma caproni]|uniref:PHD domain-containing protein n=1 Tax=Echinostoma caproni TaxID=27848 RepID=A0A183AMW7_9TREM|nr:unnamed protein product [Echinostoma caproni]
MPGKYVEKNYCHCSYCVSRPVITWHGDTSVRLETFEKRGLEPHLSYSVDKRKRWLLLDELREELSELTNSDGAIFVSEWNPYFEEKSNKLFHNRLNVDNVLRPGGSADLHASVTHADPNLMFNAHPDIDRGGKVVGVIDSSMKSSRDHVARRYECALRNVRKTGPRLPYSIDKRKRWLLLEELCEELSERTNSDDAIFVSEWNPFFGQKSKKLFHNCLSMDNALHTDVSGHLNTKSYIYQLLRSQYSTQNESLLCTEHSLAKKRHRSHRSHHRPPLTNEVVRPKAERKKLVKSFASIELAGPVKMPKLWINMKAAIWISVFRKLSQVIYEDIEDAKTEYFTTGENIPSIFYEGDRENDAEDCSHQPTIPSRESINPVRTDVVEVPEPLPIQITKSLQNGYVHSNWFTAQIPELLPIDIKNAVESFGLNPEASVRYLSYFTPLICIIRISPLIHHHDSNNNAYILVEEMIDQTESTTLGRMFTVQLHFGSDLTNDYFVVNEPSTDCSDEIRLGFRECDLAQRFHFDNIRDLISRARRTMVQESVENFE